jgi:hypothetical protein
MMPRPKFLPPPWKKRKLSNGAAKRSKNKSNRKERKGRINVGAGFKPAHFRVVRIIMVESFLHLRQFFGDRPALE